uniref:very-long-chain (3R)-3-hydroxyacyl-CoA dehydratase n=1 Tax=Timema poppense TaxID=170557 RepID=A0A7R9CNF9_TIMPO|nr:unnamed protein product [Timema poppensis]
MPEVLSPFVYWAQTESNLTLKVDLKDVKNPDVHLENKKLQFGAQGYGARGLNKYAFTLDFHSAIDPEESHYKVYDRNVDFTLKKKESGWWPRITGMPQKPAWLKIDFDRWKSEEDVEDDDESRDIMEDYPNMYNKLEKEELGYKRESIEGTYEAVGGPMKFCQLMQFLEVMHPMFGYTKGGFVVPLLQVLGRSIILFCMIDAEPRMHTKPVIFYLFLIWSIVELVRKNGTKLSIENRIEDQDLHTYQRTAASKLTAKNTAQHIIMKFLNTSVPFSDRREYNTNWTLAAWL